jgi:transposase
LLPFLIQFPEGHHFFQDGDPKHTSNETRLFMLLNGINNYPMPPESPHLSPIEMVWNDIKYYLCTKIFVYVEVFVCISLNPSLVIN